MEALEHSISRGYRFIEVDLHLLKDGTLVCAHGEKGLSDLVGEYTSTKEITEDQFKRCKIKGCLTPLTVADVLEYQKLHTFIVVTDKISDPSVIEKAFRYHRRDVMVEAVNICDYIKLKEMGFVPLLWTGQENWKSTLKLMFYCSVKGYDVEWITASKDSDMKYLRLLKRLYGVKVAMYTVNSLDFVKTHIHKEVDLFYTDNLIGK